MTRNLLLQLIFSVLVLVVLPGCTDDIRHRNIFDGGAGDAVIMFSFENIALTRSVADMESDIEHAYLLFYNSEANPENTLPIAAVKASVSESNPSALTFKMPLGLDPDTDYRLIAVANADSYVPDGFGSFKDYVESWSRNTSPDRQPLSLFHADPMLGNTVVSLPMNGRTVDDVPFRFSVKDGGYKVSASLSFRRNVARIDVANIVKDGFVVEGVALCNWRDAVAVASEDSQLGNRLGSVRGMLSAGYEDGSGVSFVDMPSAAADGIQQLRQSIYCFPSVSYDSYPSDRESTALIIKARYGEDTESSYYRINVGMSGNKSEVKANSKYLVTIQSVKGRGASTPEEAYAMDESLIVLSVVEDWDLDGSFAMDDKGNFMVLSTGHLDFEGNVIGNREVRILTSKGLSWDLDFKADNDASSSAFTATRLSDVAIAIGTTGKNTGDMPLSGTFTVSALTQDGGSLRVNVAVVQNPTGGSAIPDDMPFALIPISEERIKIDHEAKTIEIDGFDPNCFNSFIDIPFKVYIRPDLDIQSVSVSSSMLWPLEGRIAKDPSFSYTYCNESFDPQGTGKVCDSSGEKKEYDSFFTSSLTQMKGGDEFYISVGAMAPDDPEIGREITISSPYESPIIYRLKVAPHEAIIDDVIIVDDEGNHWMIMDRNVQEINNTSLKNYIGRVNGKKRQAYHFCSNSKFTMPFKYKSENVPFSEDKHSLYEGAFATYSYKTSMNSLRTSHLSRYKYFNTDEPLPQLYDQDNFDKWVYPTQKLMEICSEKMRVSKMRMFLNSDIPAINNDHDMPVCCYLPCRYPGDEPKETDWPRYGYFIVEDGKSQTSPSSIVFIFYNGDKVIQYNWDVRSDDNGYARLVRNLSQNELEDYKTNYLGYGSEPCRLQICHPDTYTSEELGWLPY